MSLTDAAQPMVKAWESWCRRKREWTEAKEVSSFFGSDVVPAEAEGRVSAFCTASLRRVLHDHLERYSIYVREIRRERGRWYAYVNGRGWASVSDLLQSREVAHGQAA